MRSLGNEISKQKNNKEAMRQNILINSKCLKGKPKFKMYFDIIKPKVKYELLPLEIRIQQRLNENNVLNSGGQENEKDDVPLPCEVTSPISHLGSKRMPNKKIGRRVMDILRNLEKQLMQL